MGGIRPDVVDVVIRIVRHMVVGDPIDGSAVRAARAFVDMIILLGVEEGRAVWTEWGAEQRAQGVVKIVHRSLR
jgi:hypothetical protein